MRKLMAMLIIVSLVWNALPLLSVPLPSCSLAVWTPGHFSPLGQLCLQSYHPDHQPVISFSLFSSYTEFYLKLFGFRRPSWQWGFQLSEAISDISSTYWIVSFWPDSVGSEVPLYPLGFRGADSCGKLQPHPVFDGVRPFMGSLFIFQWCMIHGSRSYIAIPRTKVVHLGKMNLVPVPYPTYLNLSTRKEESVTILVP
jgi:hypothetical protein